MRGATERRKLAARERADESIFSDKPSHAAAFVMGHIAGQLHGEKTTLADVVAWLRNEADGRDDPPALADAIERDEAEGVAG